MKILQINTTSNWGSHGRIAEEIGILIKKIGGENYIIYGRYSNPSQSHSFKFNTKIDLYSHVFLTRFFDMHGLASNKVTYNIINKIKEINPDLIHLHNIHGYYLNYSILFKFLSKSNIPIVWVIVHIILLLNVIIGKPVVIIVAKRIHIHLHGFLIVLNKII